MESTEDYHMGDPKNISKCPECNRLVQTREMHMIAVSISSGNFACSEQKPLCPVCYRKYKLMQAVITPEEARYFNLQNYPDSPTTVAESYGLDPEIQKLKKMLEEDSDL